MKQLKLRSMFVAPKGKVLVSIDLKQAETWIVAYLANEPNMKKSLLESDIHTDTAMFLDNCAREQVTDISRYKGKKSNHALSYRMSYLMLARSINKESDKPPYVVVSLPDAHYMYDRWHSLYNLKRWWSELEIELQQSRTLVTPYGRIRTFFEAWGNELFKEATAHIPQSTVADHLNGAVQPELNIRGGLLAVYKDWVVPGHIRVLNQGHDSFISEVDVSQYKEVVPQLATLIKRPLVVNQEIFTIPVDVEIGERWGELEKYKC